MRELKDGCFRAAQIKIKASSHFLQTHKEEWNMGRKQLMNLPVCHLWFLPPSLTELKTAAEICSLLPIRLRYVILDAVGNWGASLRLELAFSAAGELNLWTHADEITCSPQYSTIEICLLRSSGIQRRELKSAKIICHPIMSWINMIFWDQVI